MWPVDDIFVPPVITWLYRDTISARGTRRAFAVAGPAAWNSLSDDLRDPALSTDSFRRLLKAVRTIEIHTQILLKWQHK